MKLIGPLVALFFTIGCRGDQKEDVSPRQESHSSSSTDTPTSKPSAYTIFDLQGKQTLSVGHRYIRVVFPAPQNKEQVEKALKEIYYSYKREIEKTQPDAQYKRISILLYDSVGDAEDHDGYQICHVESSQGAEPVLPEWDKVIIDWKWRLPEYRPTKKQMGIYKHYWHELDRAAKIAEAPYVDSDGNFIGKLEDQAEIDHRKKVEVIKLVAKLCQRYNMTQTEMERLAAYVWLWRWGEEPTEERVKEYIIFYHEKWTDD